MIWCWFFHRECWRYWRFHRYESDREGVRTVADMVWVAKCTHPDCGCKWVRPNREAETAVLKGYNK